MEKKLIHFQIKSSSKFQWSEQLQKRIKTLVATMKITYSTRNFLDMVIQLPKQSDKQPADYFSKKRNIGCYKYTVFFITACHFVTVDSFDLKFGETMQD